ncbi:MAG: hypothetical protein AAGF33_16090 [Pseudomonadota bacterium]
MLRMSLIAAAALGLATGAAADEFTAVQNIDKVVTVSGADGTVSLDYQSAERVAPGDTLFYHIDYENGAAEPAENVKLVMVVPAEVNYLENTADSGNLAADLEFSADNGNTFSQRSDVQVLKGGETQFAAAGDITHIRWTFNDAVAPGTQGTVSFRATVR